MDFSKTKIERNGEVYILTLNVGMSTFCLYVNECILDSADELSRLHLFVLCDSASEGPVAGSSTICLLQRTSEEAKFRLVSASVAACFHVPRKLAHEFDPFEYVGYHAAFSYDHYRLESNIFSAYGDNLTLPLPLLRSDRPAGTHFDEEMEKMLASDIEYPGYYPYNKRTSEKSLDMENLDMFLSQPIGGSRQRWALNADPERFEYFFDVRAPYYIRFPSPRLAFPGVTDSVILLKVFQSVLDAERTGSSMEFFNFYFQIVQEFKPQLFRWKNREGNAVANSKARKAKDDMGRMIVNLKYYDFNPRNNEVDVVDLVQLRFKPDQYDVLESILDSVKKDVARGISSKQADRPPFAEANGLFNPPFLRIGWSDLALNEADEEMEEYNLNHKDAYGFNALNVINRAIDEEKCRKDGFNQAVAEEPDLRDSVGHISNMWVYYDSIVRQHRGQTLWVAFDLLSLTLWAQTHPYMAELRGLSRFCKDGENEVTRLLRPPTEGEKWIKRLNWPHDVMEDFKVDGQLYTITIV
ncbi:hypothetical protein CGCSCA4_v001658 [Colletotrichum siamense]|uniref:Uncharacterized protein n=1 Tax=Colletotrichum siamense TaxID=690259 RepID=A0A9P5F0C1_COLSI|nr:hypothetical protein CGCSCA4_v001658 [Colletotrichum siamense]KAF4864424.1 hypothetical protein CGCSCA2_v001794 [Colletotrichum siamense]